MRYNKKNTYYEQMQEQWKKNLEERMMQIETEQKKGSLKNTFIKMSNVLAQGFNAVTENQVRQHAEMTKLHHELQSEATKGILEKLENKFNDSRPSPTMLMPPPPSTSKSSELNFSLKTKKDLTDLKMLETKPLGDVRDILSSDLKYTPHIKNLLIKMNDERSQDENEKDITFWLFVALKKVSKILINFY